MTREPLLLSPPLRAGQGGRGSRRRGRGRETRGGFNGCRRLFEVETGEPLVRRQELTLQLLYRLPLRTLPVGDRERVSLTTFFRLVRRR